jgi:HAD superfamily hydrolase (TIGR01450 family)
VAAVDEFDGFLVDLDGVVWEGRDFLPGSVEALRALIEAEKEVVFVTNNSVRRPDEYAERLRQGGAPVADERVVTSGVATAGLAVEKVGSGASAFVIGSPRFKEVTADAGLELRTGEAAQRADAVLVSAHREFDYAELLTATRAIQNGAALFGTSRDPTLPMPGGAWPGTGATLAAVETATGKTAEIGGKPERHLFDQARALIGEAERVAMVGDRIASDIEGGRRAGLTTILVLSGAASREDSAAADPTPDLVLDDLAALLR